jgi:hypothetical protein
MIEVGDILIELGNTGEPLLVLEDKQVKDKKGYRVQFLLSGYKGWLSGERLHFHYRVHR